ncbi:MAG: B12-binding domain-containing radical SAM protein [Myxococcales bacterium]|nr:B12-binding domain-containing radical SAM protein [Myxococcales bacterium]MDH5567890.1 B12-binding domain-containing radical SAM protein [Myxococcales bacterium]
MKVFLIYVRDEDFYKLLPEDLGGSRAENGRIRVMAFPPLGVETLAPVLRQRGHEVRMFDTCHPQMKPEHILQAAIEDAPDVFALSFLSTTTYPTTKSLARLLKSRLPAIPIIAGGVFATMNAKRIMGDCADFDAVGIGEGEELLPDYLDHLDDPACVAGLVWRRGAEVVNNPSRPILRDLDRFPYPDRTTLPIDYIESLPLDVPAVLSLEKFCTMQTSRGCPYTCIYCDIPALTNGKWRHRSPEHVLGEMQQLHDQGYRSIYLTDDHFLLKRNRIRDICQGIIDRKLEFKWGCEGRVDSVAVDQLPIMAKANCNFLAFGVEAGTQKILDRLDKKQTLEQIERAVSEAKQQGIGRAHGFFLVGSPGETEEDILESFRFAARLKLDTFGFNRLCVYRGTPLWKEYLERGILDDDRDWDQWFKCSDIDPTILPSEVVNRIRQKGYALLFARRIFFRPIQTIRLLRTLGRHMKKSDILKLLASPFRRRALTRKPALPARMIDPGRMEPIRETASGGARPSVA